MSGLVGTASAVKGPATGDLDLSALPTHNHRPMCFRIAGVPLTWSKHDLLHTLQTIDPSLKGQEPQLSLYPACCGSTQTGLLNLDTCTEYFRRLEPTKFNYEQISETASKTEALLVIDSHFYDLTPLNTPEGEVVADVIAVTGLAGHAFGSWRSRETRRMWLKDFLPKDVKNIRIMTYGYDSSLVGHRKSDARLADYRRNFTQQLENSRSSAKNRPIIFLGHSLGGILILQTLIESNRNPHHKPILDSTHGIFFFGTPHQGLRTDELEEMVDVDSGGQRNNLIMQLKEGSEYLEDQKENLLRIWEGFKRKVVSFYETVKTPSVRKLESGEFTRDGTEVQMVQIFSAQLYIPSEHRLPVEKNHTDIVKFASQVDTTYQTVVKLMKDCIAQGSPQKILLSVINGLDPDHFLSLLSAVDQEKHRSTIRPLDCDQPKFYWIFRDCDFIQWNLDNSPVLWLSGPTECGIDQVSSNIIRLEMDAASGSQHFVLYFFCSTVVTARSTVTVFIHTLLHQVICCLAPDRQRAIVTTFLKTLLGRVFDWEPSCFKGDDPSDTTLRKILDAPNSDLWVALKAALDVERERKLSIIIDGLDRVERQKPEFIKGLKELVAYLLERPLKPKALLISRPQADIKEMLDGLLCIEYDKERKECLNTLRFENTRYDKISEEHKGSLQWLWAHEKYRVWLSADSSDLLLIEGKPGSGKSTLTKYFKRNLLKREPLARQAIVASFFYSYREGELQTNHSSMLRSILFDVLNQNESFFFHFQQYYRDALQSGTHFRWPYGSLKKILSSFRDHPVAERLFLVMDGMDESNNEDRRDIAQLLGQICSTKNACIVKIFLASRPISELNRHTLQGHNVIKLQDVNKADISGFVRSFLGPDLDFPSEILHQATEYIVQNAQGVFVWVHLVKQELLKYAENGCSSEEIFDFLQSLPTELEEFYKRMLDELEKREERYIKDGLRMFRFVLFAYRPLRLAELHHALAIPDDIDAEFSSSDESFKRKLVHGIDKRIIHCGGNFLEIKDVHENSSVQVIHQTVREFFRPDGSTAKSKFRMNGDDAHIRISITCIRYLTLCAANTTLANKLPNSESWASGHFEAYARYLNERPFISYALSYLKEHLHKCSQAADVSRFVPQLCEKLTNNPASYLLESWVAPDWSQTLATREQREYAKDFRNRLLHTATRMKLSRVVEVLLIAGAEVDTCMNDKKTPLIVSAEIGDEATARVLLDLGAFIEAKDNNKQTALHLAAANGRDTMVRLLVDRGADKEAKDGQGQVALHLATANGSDTMVRLLVDRGADKEAKDGQGQVALHLAADRDQGATVKLLIDRGAYKEAKNQSSRTAVHLAAASGHDTTVQLLIETLGVDKEAEDESGWTALHLAAGSGHHTTVQLLVETLGVDKEAMNNRGQTALHVAAGRGQDTTVRLLVQTFGIDKEAKDHKGRTALHTATLFGRESTVKLLVNQFMANREGENSEKWTALHFAAAVGLESMVRLLVNTLHLNKGAQDQRGQTALDLARK